MNNRRSLRTLLLFFPTVFSAGVAARSSASDDLAPPTEALAVSQEELVTNGGGTAVGLDERGKSGGNALGDNSCATSKQVTLHSTSAPLIRTPKVYFLFWTNY